jgi:hypothetical protein
MLPGLLFVGRILLVLMGYFVTLRRARNPAL